jgi:phosphatidylinositol-3-phosphatase
MTLAAVLALAALVGIGTAGAGGAPVAKAHKQPPHLKHVFIIVLENENADTTFGPKSDAPYLSKTLRKKGEYLPNYYATGHLSLDNYISMISGQAPNPTTQGDCQNYVNFTPGIPSSAGQYVGEGCVYPAGVETVANQLEDSGYTWHGYMQDMANGGAGVAKSCRHPEIGSSDDTQSARRGDQYAARHNPFVYFHSIIDFPTCTKNDVDLSRLPHDLKSEKRTANYVFITPNLCYDGHDAPCVDGKPGGLKSANVYLKKWVPRILRSRAYKDRGALLITFDEAEFGSDASACCNEPTGPNTPSPGITGPGGGRVGAVVLSPCVKAGSVNKTAYNHYSMLRSIEDNFGLPHLGYAGQSGLKPFGSKTFNRRRCKAY